MRIAIAVVGVLVATASAAHADCDPVLWIGGTFAATSYANATDQPANLWGGGRLTLSFEDRALPIPPAGLGDHQFRAVPEIFAGFYMNDERARSQFGVGVRGELWATRSSTDEYGRGFHIRIAMYGAVRAKLAGPNADSGAEFMLGEYIVRDNGTRFGWEGGLGVIKRENLELGQSPELEALVNVYVGFGGRN
ncbi:MAG: hypothetical protein QM831_18485 [Kofleriaceae bacterium]